MGYGALKMGQLLTANAATNLYWLGRYIQRINELLTYIMPAYDKSIDIDIDAGKKLYKGFSIDIEYHSAHEFLKEAMFGNHDSNLATLAEYAKENAIICRSYISTEAFGEIIELHAIMKNASKSYLDIDYKLINDALSLISEIWGEIFKISQSSVSDHFLKLGRLIEQLDFHLRFHLPNKHSANITKSIDTTLALLKAGNETQKSQEQLQTNSDHTIIDHLHAKVTALIVY